MRKAAETDILREEEVSATKQGVPMGGLTEVAIIFFLVGFGAALLAGRSLRFRRHDAGLRKLPMQKGAVRLDLLASKQRVPVGRTDRGTAAGRAEADDALPPGAAAPTPPESSHPGASHAPRGK